MRITQQVSINLPKVWVAKLRELAHKESLKTGQEIIYTDLIRTAIEDFHPDIKMPSKVK